MDKDSRLRRLKKIYADILKRQYPARMQKDKALVLHALERRIFKLNGDGYGLHSEQKIQAPI